MAGFYEMDFYPEVITIENWNFIRNTVKYLYGTRAEIKMDLIESAVKGLYQIHDTKEARIKSIEIINKEKVSNKQPVGNLLKAMMDKVGIEKNSHKHIELTFEYLQCTTNLLGSSIDSMGFILLLELVVDFAKKNDISLHAEVLDYYEKHRPVKNHYTVDCLHVVMPKDVRAQKDKINELGDTTVESFYNDSSDYTTSDDDTPPQTMLNSAQTSTTKYLPVFKSLTQYSTPYAGLNETGTPPTILNAALKTIKDSSKYKP